MTLAVIGTGDPANNLKTDRQTVGAFQAHTEAVFTEAVEGGQGLLTKRDAALSNTAVEIKAGAGRLYWYNIFNPNTTLAYLQFYDKAAAGVVVGTDAPKLSLALPSNSTAQVGLDVSFSIPFEFETAMSMAATQTASGGTAPSTALVVNVGYR